MNTDQGVVLKERVASDYGWNETGISNLEFSDSH
jgi:hypothetical protein